MFVVVLLFSSLILSVIAYLLFKGSYARSVNFLPVQCLYNNYAVYSKRTTRPVACTSVETCAAGERFVFLAQLSIQHLQPVAMAVEEQRPRCRARGEMARLQVCLDLVVLASFYGAIPCRIISGDLAKRPGIIMTGARWCEINLLMHMQHKSNYM